MKPEVAIELLRRMQATLPVVVTRMDRDALHWSYPGPGGILHGEGTTGVYGFTSRQASALVDLGYVRRIVRGGHVHKPRKRHLYAITEAGLRAIGAWPEEPGP